MKRRRYPPSSVALRNLRFMPGFQSQNRLRLIFKEVLLLKLCWLQCIVISHSPQVSARERIRPVLFLGAIIRPMETKPESKRQIKKQVVAGFVIFRRTQDGIKYLLLYKRGQYWNFPKGHFELGENSLDTALRETNEETGIDKNDMRIIPEFRAYEKFYFDRGNERIFDTVILYLAETRESKVSISPREHGGFAWFLYHDALKVIGKQYAGTKRVLKQANDFIRERQRRHQARLHPVPAHQKRPIHPGHEHKPEHPRK